MTGFMEIMRNAPAPGAGGSIVLRTLGRAAPDPHPGKPPVSRRLSHRTTRRENYLAAGIALADRDGRPDQGEEPLLLKLVHLCSYGHADNPPHDGRARGGLPGRRPPGDHSAIAAARVAVTV